MTAGTPLAGEARAGDWSRHHRLSAVIPPTGRRQTMFDGPADGDSVRSLGAWLALHADIPFTGHDRPEP